MLAGLAPGFSRGLLPRQNKQNHHGTHLPSLSYFLSLLPHYARFSAHLSSPSSLRSLQQAARIAHNTVQHAPCPHPLRVGPAVPLTPPVSPKHTAFFPNGSSSLRHTHDAKKKEKNRAQPLLLPRPTRPILSFNRLSHPRRENSAASSPSTPAPSFFRARDHGDRALALLHRAQLAKHLARTIAVHRLVPGGLDAVPSIRPRVMQPRRRAFGARRRNSLSRAALLHIHLSTVRRASRLRGRLIDVSAPPCRRMKEPCARCCAPTTSVPLSHNSNLAVVGHMPRHLSSTPR
jgi:hypothetical protein